MKKSIVKKTKTVLIGENEVEGLFIEFDEVDADIDTTGVIFHILGDNEVLDNIKKGDKFTAGFVQDTTMSEESYKVALLVDGDHETFGYFIDLEVV